MATFIVVPMAIHSADLTLYCYIAAFISFVVCLIASSRTRNANTADAAVNGSIINNPPMLSDGPEGCDGGGGDGSD